MSGNQRFVVDGYTRAVEAVRERITNEVIADFISEPDRAGFFRRYWIRHKMAREIERRMRKAPLPPPDALYSMDGGERDE